MRWMFRFSPLALVALLAAPAPALVVAMKPGVQRAVTADVVVVGKVTAIEKDTIEARPFPTAPTKVEFKVAIVKIDSALAGVNNQTHIKVGFIPQPTVDPNVPPPQPGLVRPPIRRPGLQAPELKVGDEYMLFLVKHPEGGFYSMPNMSPPIDMKNDGGKKEAEQIKKVLTALADPMKGLKSAKAEERLLTATSLVMKYRTYPDRGGEVDQQPIPVEESRLILKALAEAEWNRFDPNGPNAMQAFYQLGLTPQDGWAQPKAQPGVNYQTQLKTAFTTWVDGAGKNYQIKKLVPKTK